MMREFIPLPERTEVAAADAAGAFRMAEIPVAPPGESDLLFRVLTALLTREHFAAAPGGRGAGPVVVGEIAAVGGRTRGWDVLDRAVITLDRDGARAGIPARQADSGSGAGFPATAAPAAVVLPAWVRVPAAAVRRGRLHKLPMEIPVESALFLPAAARAARALREMHADAEGAILVAGVGLVSLMAMLMARHQKVPTIIAADASPTLRRRAEWSGATHRVSLPEDSLHRVALQATEGRGVSGALVLPGDRLLAEEALASLAPGGALVVAEGGDAGGGVALEPASLWARELRLVGMRSPDARAWRDARQALRQGLVDTDTLVSKRLDWSGLDGFAADREFWRHAVSALVELPEAAGAD